MEKKNAHLQSLYTVEGHKNQKVKNFYGQSLKFKWCIKIPIVFHVVSMKLLCHFNKNM